MNDKQRKFCHELLKHNFNQTKAYMAAYPDSSNESAQREASRLLRNVEVSEYVEELKKEMKEEDLVTVQEVINGIKEDIQGAKLNNQFSAAMKGRELLGKYLAIFSERLKVEDDRPSKIAEEIKKLREEKKNCKFNEND